MLFYLNTMPSRSYRQCQCFAPYVQTRIDPSQETGSGDRFQLQFGPSFRLGDFSLSSRYQIDDGIFLNFKRYSNETLCNQYKLFEWRHKTNFMYRHKDRQGGFWVCDIAICFRSVENWIRILAMSATIMPLARIVEATRPLHSAY